VKPTFNTVRVCDSLKKYGPLTKQELRDRLALPDSTVRGTLSNLVVSGCVVRVGRGTYRYVMHPLAPVRPSKDTTAEYVARGRSKPEQSAGTGEIVRPQQPREFRPLKRDPFEAMRLALLIRDQH
jgi:hypothetical protein